MLEAICVWGFSIATAIKIACVIFGLLAMIIGAAMGEDLFASPKTCLTTFIAGVVIFAFGLLFPTEGAWETLLEIARRP